MTLPMTEIDFATTGFEPTKASFIADPYPVYSALRESRSGAVLPAERVSTC